MKKSLAFQCWLLIPIFKRHISQTKDIFGEVQQVPMFATSGLNRNDWKVYLHFNIYVFSFESQESFERTEMGVSTGGI